MTEQPPHRLTYRYGLSPPEISQVPAKLLFLERTALYRKSPSDLTNMQAFLWSNPDISKNSKRPKRAIICNGNQEPEELSGRFWQQICTMRLFKLNEGWRSSSDARSPSLFGSCWVPGCWPLPPSHPGPAAPVLAAPSSAELPGWPSSPRHGHLSTQLT